MINIWGRREFKHVSCEMQLSHRISHIKHRRCLTMQYLPGRMQHNSTSINASLFLSSSSSFWVTEEESASPTVCTPILGSVPNFGLVSFEWRASFSWFSRLLTLAYIENILVKTEECQNQSNSRIPAYQYIFITFFNY